MININASSTKKDGRLIIADTLAYLLYGACGGALALFYETVVVGLTLKQWGSAHLLYNTLRYPGAFLCGRLTNKIRRLILKTQDHNRFRRGVADTITLSTYQIPLYITSALIMGASISQTTIIAPFHLIDNFGLGWFYGMILDWMRLRFGIRVQKV